MLVSRMTLVFRRNIYGWLGKIVYKGLRLVYLQTTSNPFGDTTVVEDVPSGQVDLNLPTSVLPAVKSFISAISAFKESISALVILISSISSSI